MSPNKAALVAVHLQLGWELALLLVPRPVSPASWHSVRPVLRGSNGSCKARARSLGRRGLR